MLSQLRTRLILPGFLVIAIAGAITALAVNVSADVDVTSTVNSSSDDAYHGADHFPAYSSTDVVIHAGWPNAGGNRSTTGGWRFTGLALPACAVVTEAYAELPAANFGYTTTTTLALEDALDPPTFTPDNTPLDRWANRTAFETNWVVDPDEAVTWFQTPSLVDGVQELIDTYGDVGVVVLLENGDLSAPGIEHLWLSFDKGYAAKLIIRYACDEPEPTPTPEPSPTPTSTPEPTPTPSPTPTATPTPQAGGEGCTPGYWKQKHHFDSWVDFDPGDSFDDVFGVDSSFGGTLLDALKRGGGGEKALGRHAVAALLNSASDVESSFTVADVVQAVQDAYESGDFELLKNILDEDNNSGCPLN